MKKSLLLVTVTVLIALGLAACSGGSENGATPGTPDWSGTTSPGLPGPGTTTPTGTGTPVPPASGSSP